MNANSERNEQRPLGQYRPSLCFYHASPKGTGSAVKMQLHPAHDDTDGCVMLTIANQMAVGNPSGETPSYSRFDWENAICVKLDFGDLSHILQVLRGECESVNDGKGLYHRSVRGSTNIRFGHMVEPVSGYLLDIYRKGNKGPDDETHARMLFGPSEGFGLCEALSASLLLVGFGIPMLVPHDTAAYKAAARQLRNVAAA